MKVFVSSVVRGFEAERDAVVAAAKALGHDVRRSEDFPAADTTPRRACLAGVRWAEVVVLVLGARYGDVQETGRSATHEEYREARDSTAVLAFVQQGVRREEKQGEFVTEVQSWAAGRLIQPFMDASGLRDAVTKSLHAFELAAATGPADEATMVGEVRALLKATERGRGGASISLAVACGPRQTILRPKEIESRSFVQEIQKEAIFGSSPVLSSTAATRPSLSGDRLRLDQDDAAVQVDAAGGVLITQPATEQSREFGLASLIEEDIAGRLDHGLAFALWLVERVDPKGRVTHVVPAVRLDASYQPWRTRAEQQRRPNSANIPMGDAPEAVLLSPPSFRREALTVRRSEVIEDFISLLRRGRAG